MSTKSTLRMLAAVAVMALLPLAAQGAVFADRSLEPEQRLELWLGSFERFLAQNPDLTPEQLAVISEATNVGVEHFADHPGAVESQILKIKLDSAKKLMSCTDFAAILVGFDGLSSWLEEVKAIPSDEVPTCNCDSNADCSDGFHCARVKCISSQGTENWGICQL